MTRADEQLLRLLQAFPLMADEPQLSMEALAQRLRTTVKTLRNDLAALDRDDVPAAWTESVELHIGPGIVSMRSSHFKRPPRLTRPEIAALELGLGMLAQEVAAEERGIVRGVRSKLTEAAAEVVETVVDRRRAQQRLITSGTEDVQAEMTRVAAEPARTLELDTLAALHRAMERSVAVDITYHRPDEPTPRMRRVHPYVIVRAEANLYLVGYCERAATVRVFRLDRVVTAADTTQRFETPVGFSVESVLQGGRVFARDDAELDELVIRYSAEVARWIAERDNVGLSADGSVTIRYPLADTAWAVRHVLQYGPDATVVAPDGVREEVTRTLQAMLSSDG